MDTTEARQVLAEELKGYESKPYAELIQRIGENLSFERQASSGAQYQIEILFLWDAEPNGPIRVIGSIDDGGWRAFLPLNDSILKYPEG